jgi:hypothetical protein
MVFKWQTIMEFKESDVMELASSIKSVIEQHEVPSELADVLFHVTRLIDSKQKTNFHESIFELIDRFVPALSDHLVCDICLHLYNGECLETNILGSNIDSLDGLILNLEFTLKLRKISEIDKIIDTEKRFKKIQIIKIVFDAFGHKSESYSNNFSSLIDLAIFIRETAKKLAHKNL